MEVREQLPDSHESAELHSKVGTLSLRIAVESSVGRKRTENQDGFSVVVAPQSTSLLVADGMGGSVGGKTASSLALSLLSSGLYRMGPKTTTGGLRNILVETNSALHEKSRHDMSLKGMGTTLVCLLVDGQKVLYSNLGDSRLYLLRESELRQLSTDHTFGKEIEKLKASEQPVQASMGHLLTRVLGTQSSVPVDISELPGGVKKGDIFLLCSDGLTKHVSDRQIAKTLFRLPPASAARELVREAHSEGGSDNITVSVVHVEEVLPGAIYSPYGIVHSFIPPEIRAQASSLDPSRNKTTTQLSVHEAELSHQRAARESYVGSRAIKALLQRPEFIVMAVLLLLLLIGIPLLGQYWLE